MPAIRSAKSTTPAIPRVLYYAGKAYLDPHPLTLADPYANSELGDLGRFDFTGVAGAAYDAHKIGTIIALESRPHPKTVGPTLESLLTGENGAIVAAVLRTVDGFGPRADPFVYRAPAEPAGGADTANLWGGGRRSRPLAAGTGLRDAAKGFPASLL